MTNTNRPRRPRITEEQVAGYALVLFTTILLIQLLIRPLLTFLF